MLICQLNSYLRCKHSDHVLLPSFYVKFEIVFGVNGVAHKFFGVSNTQDEFILFCIKTKRQRKESCKMLPSE